MYEREILPPGEGPIRDGRQVVGTWNRAFPEVDFLAVRKPYRWPLPAPVRDMRIKEWQGFSVQDDRFLLEAALGDFKLFKAVRVFLYFKESGETFSFDRILVGKRWRMPGSLDNASVECRATGFFLRSHSWLKANAVKLDVDIAAARNRPAFTAHLSFAAGGRESPPVAVSLAFDDGPGMYAFKSLAAVRGDLVLDGRHISLNPARCSGIFRDHKGFYPYRMMLTCCSGLGFDDSGRRFGFHICENQARESRRNNENVLWLGRQMTPLPPVRVTRGPEEGQWMIQDTDGMVDLTFTPKCGKQYMKDLFAVKGNFFAPIGCYNGMIANSKGERILLKDRWGTGEQLYLRM